MAKIKYLVIGYSKVLKLLDRERKFEGETPFTYALINEGPDEDAHLSDAIAEIEAKALQYPTIGKHVNEGGELSSC